MDARLQAAIDAVRLSLLALCAAAAALLPPGAAAADCPPAGWDRQRLDALRGAGFVIADASQRDAWALAIVPCLSAPDPALRDGIAYEGLATLLRAGSLSIPAQQQLTTALVTALEPAAPSAFGPSFAALVLAEVVRADLARRGLAADQLQVLARRGAAFLAGVRDRRAFDAREGWLHAVAHGGDLLAQLARHPVLDVREMLVAMRDAVAAQVAPADHAYVHGEAERLMAPIVLLAQRRVFSATDWLDWFARLVDPAPLLNWGESFATPAGQVRRHNTRAFLFAVLVESRLNANTDDDVLLAAAEAALRRMR